MYNNCHVQYFKTVPCKGAADALLWLKDFLDQKKEKLQCTIFLPCSQVLAIICLVHESCKSHPRFFRNSSIAVSTNFHLKNAVHIL